MAPNQIQCKSQIPFQDLQGDEDSLEFISFSRILITSLNSLPDFFYLAHLAPALLVSSVFLEYARQLVPWVLDICYPSTCNAPSPDRRWTSSLTAFKSLLKSHVLSETLPGLPFYPVSASCLEFQFTIPCSISLFSFPLFNTNQFENTLYLLIVSWLLSDTLK